MFPTMAEISLSRNLVTIVDDADAEWLRQWNWYAQQTRSGVFYAARNNRKVNGKRQQPAILLMHRVIMDAAPDVLVDHINGDKLDNRRDNLRFVDNSLNMSNSETPRTDNILGVRNVVYDGRYKLPYKVEMIVQGRRIRERYATLVEADCRAKEVRAEARKETL